MNHRIRSILPLALCIALAACAQPGSSTSGAGAPSASSPQASAPSIDAQIGKALTEVTLARQASTALAKAGTISWLLDDHTQAALTMVRDHLTIAQSIVPTNPAQAAQLLAEALTDLAKYQGASQ